MARLFIRFPDQAMRTVDKALKLLAYYTDTRPEIGLSELARLSGQDKATVHRMLKVLTDHGILEQNPASKTYRLGAEILRLARLREACFPVGTIVDPVLKDLAAKTGETAHASMIAGTQLASIGSAEPERGNRVHIEPGLIQPYHATASGLAFLSFCSPAFADAILNKPLARFTDYTDCDAASLRKRMAECAAGGVAISDLGYEADVCSTAAPLFDSDGMACGAVAVAAPTSRMNRQARKAIIAAVVMAACEITRGLGGEPSGAFKSATERLAA